MPGYTVELLYKGDEKGVPFPDSKMRSLFSASVDTFEARLQGYWSRIVEWPSGDVVCTMPPVSVYVSPTEFWRGLTATKKALKVLGL